jgi:hypothetical protein
MTIDKPDHTPISQRARQHPANPVAGLARKLKLTAKVKARQDAAKKKAMTRDERDSFLAAAERIERWLAPLWTVQTLLGSGPARCMGSRRPTSTSSAARSGSSARSPTTASGRTRRRAGSAATSTSRTRPCACSGHT